MTGHFGENDAVRLDPQALNERLFDLCEEVNRMSEEYLRNPTPALRERLAAADRLVTLARGAGTRPERLIPPGESASQ